MPLRVRDDQRQLCGEVSQVVHHEGRETVVGLELAAFGQAAIGVELRDVHSHVTAHHLEQVAVLVVRFERLWRRREHDEADQCVHVRQGHDQPAAVRLIAQLPADDPGQR